MNSTQSLTKPPLLPRPLKLPLLLVPGVIQRQIISRSLNLLFRQELLDDELEFLDGKIVALKIEDAGLLFHLALHDKQISCLSNTKNPDLTMQGTVYDFLLMLSRKEDPDTLFFNRRLRLSGDTELGLYVKNFLDALEMTGQWKTIHRLSKQALGIAERIG